MKQVSPHIPSPLARFLSLRKIGPCLLFLTLHLAATRSEAAILAEFTGGGSSASPVTNTVDAWSGKAGEGWLTEWRITANSGVISTMNVTNASPLDSHGNHLGASLSFPDAAAGNGNIHRQYGENQEVKLNQAQTVSFLLRLDSSLATLDRFRLWDGTSTGALIETGSGEQASWFIRTSGSVWKFGNGGVANANLVSSGISIVAGNVYRFTLDIDPATKSYVVTLVDLTADLSYTSPTLGFASNVTQVGGNLNFGVTKAAGDTPLAWSLDSVSVTAVPEPTSAALVGGGLLLIVAHSMRRRF